MWGLADRRARCCAIKSPTVVNVKVFQEQETDMNWDQAAGNWKQLKGKVKEQWGDLTDDDLDRIAGQRDQLVGKIQKSYGLTREEANKRVAEWEKL